MDTGCFSGISITSVSRKAEVSEVYDKSEDGIDLVFSIPKTNVALEINITNKGNIVHASLRLDARTEIMDPAKRLAAFTNGAEGLQNFFNVYIPNNLVYISETGVKLVDPRTGSISAIARDKPTQLTNTGIALEYLITISLPSLLQMVDSDEPDVAFKYLDNYLHEKHDYLYHKKAKVFKVVFDEVLPTKAPIYVSAYLVSNIWGCKSFSDMESEGTLVPSKEILQIVMQAKSATELHFTIDKVDRLELLRQAFKL